eukprot:jgi/Hompol1/624/HPOL_005372-RA
MPKRQASDKPARAAKTPSKKRVKEESDSDAYEYADNDQVSDDDSDGNTKANKDEFGVLERIKLPPKPVPKVRGPKGTVYDFTLEFLGDLAKNNEREWFNVNRNRYEASKENFIELCEQLLQRLQKEDPDLESLDVKSSMMRINRDLRFGHDKSPYRNYLSVAFKRDGKKSAYGGYYFHLQPGNQSMIGAGIFDPWPETVRQMRARIESDPDGFCRHMDSQAIRKSFGDSGRDFFVDCVSKMDGGALKTAPKGVAKDHASIDLLKLKRFVIYKHVPDSEILAKNAVESLAAAFLALVPFVRGLNEIIDEQE